MAQHRVVVGSFVLLAIALVSVVSGEVPQPVVDASAARSPAFLEQWAASTPGSLSPAPTGDKQSSPPVVTCGKGTICNPQLPNGGVCCPDGLHCCIEKCVMVTDATTGLKAPECRFNDARLTKANQDNKAKQDEAAEKGFQADSNDVDALNAVQKTKIPAAEKKAIEAALQGPAAEQALAQVARQLDGKKSSSASKASDNKSKASTNKTSIDQIVAAKVAKLETKKEEAKEAKLQKEIKKQEIVLDSAVKAELLARTNATDRTNTTAHKQHIADLRTKQKASAEKIAGLRKKLKLVKKELKKDLKTGNSTKSSLCGLNSCSEMMLTLKKLVKTEQEHNAAMMKELKKYLAQAPQKTKPPESDVKEGVALAKKAIKQVDKARKVAKETKTLAGEAKKKAEKLEEAAKKLAKAAATTTDKKVKKRAAKAKKKAAAAKKKAKRLAKKAKRAAKKLKKKTKRVAKKVKKAAKKAGKSVKSLLKKGLKKKKQKKAQAKLRRRFKGRPSLSGSMTRPTFGSGKTQRHQERLLLNKKKGFRNYGNGLPPMRIAIERNICILSGHVTPGIGNVATLPPACRPSQGRMTFTALEHSKKGDRPVRVDITRDGKVYQSTTNAVIGDTTAWISYAGVMFAPKGGRKLDLAQGWKTAGGDTAPATIQSLNGVCLLAGRMTGAAWGVMGRIPRNCRPDSRVLFSSNNDKHPIRVDMDTVANVTMIACNDKKEHKQPWVALDGIAWVPKGGKPIDLAADWAPLRDGYRHPVAMKLGKLVFVSGVAHPSNQGGQLTRLVGTLPPAYAPKATVILGTSHGRDLTRVEVHPDGKIMYAGNPVLLDSGDSHKGSRWLSLSGLTYMVDHEGEPDGRPHAEAAAPVSSLPKNAPSDADPNDAINMDLNDSSKSNNAVTDTEEENVATDTDTDKDHETEEVKDEEDDERSERPTPIEDETEKKAEEEEERDAAEGKDDYDRSHPGEN